MPRGRKRPAWAPIKRNFLYTQGYPGARLLSTEVEARQIDVPLIVKAQDIADLQKVKEDLADWLITEQECELIFDDEPDRTYLALIDGSFDAEELVNRGKGVVTFICTMPYKLGPTQTVEFQADERGLSTNIQNKGSVKSNPIIEIKVAKPSTFLDVWFEAEKLKERNYFRIGWHLEWIRYPLKETSVLCGMKCLQL